MIRVYIAVTYADIAEKILYDKTTGFANTITKLKEIQTNAANGGIDVSAELEIIIRLFQSFHIMDTDGTNYYSWENQFCISKPQKLIGFVNEYAAKYYQVNNIEKAWLFILRSLNEAIDEFYRYGEDDTWEDIRFMKNILVFLSYSYVFSEERK